MADIFDLADLWDDAARTYTAIKMDVTDTASASDSLLLDLLVGGTSEFQVAKTGQVLAGLTAANSPTYSFIGDPDTGWGYRQANTLSAIVSGIESLRISLNRVDAFSGDLGASAGGALALGGAGTFDVFLERDAANTLAQRNGTNAQTSRLFGTYTDASNGRWLEMAVTTGGVASITPTGNGTGASGNVLHISGLPTSNPGPGILWNNAGTPAIGT